MADSNGIKKGGLTAIVAGIVASLPDNRISAPSGAWHWAFLQLRDRHSPEVPELRDLEFIRSPGSYPISERLEGIFQVIDIAGTGSTLNPTLIVRQFDRPQKQRLKRRIKDRISGRGKLMAELGRELQDLLIHAPRTA